MSQSYPYPDELFALLAVEWSLLTSEQLTGIKANPESAPGDSLPEKIADLVGLTDADRLALDWMVERTLTEDSADGVSQTLEQRLVRPGQRQHLSPEQQSSESEPSTSRTENWSIGDGRYVKQRFHASGGTGRVWLARDVRFDREVALKELQPRRRTGQSAQRFLMEARVTGQLEHPGIAPVYDLYEDEDSVFYTMRFIQGRTLQDAISEFHGKPAARKSSLELADLLNSFVAVCNAVEYAHSRGVIHRDLKGKNVALGEFGEVVVLDWGLAKVVNASDNDEEFHGSSDPRGVETTQDGSVVGTPSYMSPEQALGENAAIDERSDVYSLGVVLYELLTGKVPFCAEYVSQLLEKVVAEQPVRPSQLDSSLPRPLESVCLRALSKRPEDRQASARELGDEVRRYLADEPIPSFAETTFSRFGRWARRNRTKVATAASLLLVMVVGLSTGAILLADANRRINDQWIRAEQNARRANINFDESLKTVNHFYTVVSENRLLDVPRLTPLRHELLKGAIDHFDRIAEKAPDDPQLQALRAVARFRMARLWMEVGKSEEAYADLQECLKTHEDFLQRGHTEELGAVHYARVMASLSEVEMKRGREKESRQWRQQAVSVLEEFLSENPDDRDGRLKLARFLTDYAHHLFSTRHLDEAVPKLERSVEMCRALLNDYPEKIAVQLLTAEVLCFRGVVYREARETEVAEASFREAVEIYEGLNGEERLIPRERGGIATCYHSYAMLVRPKGRQNEARELLEKSASIRSKLMEEFPSLPDHRSALALTLTSLGNLHLENEHWDKALNLYSQAAKINRSLSADFPNVLDYTNDLAANHNNLAIVRRSMGEIDRALADYEECIRLRKLMLEIAPDALHVSIQLGNCYCNIGRLYLFQKRFGAALMWHNNSVQHLEAIRDRIGADPRLMFHLVRAYAGRAESLLGLSRFNDSAEQWKAAAEKETGQEQQYLLMCRARAIAASGAIDEAVEEANHLLASGTVDSETIYESARVYAICFSKRAQNHANEGDPAEPKTPSRSELLKMALQSLEQAREAGYFENSGLDEAVGEKDLEPIRETEEFQAFVASHWSEHSNSEPSEAESP